jgi:hypothetical protein
VVVTVPLFPLQRRQVVVGGVQPTDVVPGDPLFHEIAVRCAGEIRELLAKPLEGMNTSVTKVIDNAILGFMLPGKPRLLQGRAGGSSS